MKKRLLMVLATVAILVGLMLLASCNQSGTGEKGEKGDTGNGIFRIITDKVEGGTQIRIIYTDTSKEDVVFVIPDGEQGIQGEKGEQGEQGIQGEKGEPGEQGIQGEKGDRGEQGIQGEKGEQGGEGRSIINAYISDGYLWLFYSDAPDTPVNAGKINSSSGNADPKQEDVFYE